MTVRVAVAVAVAVRDRFDRGCRRLRRQDGLALLDAPDGVVEVADDAAHRLDERVAQAQQLIDLARDGLRAQVCLGPRAGRLLLRLGEDRAGGHLGGGLHLVDPLLRGLERLGDLGLAGAPAVELDPRVAQLVLDLARTLTRLRDVLLEMAHHEAQLRKGHLDLCTAVSEQRQPQPLT